MNNQRSLADRVPEEEFKKIIKESISCADAMRRMGYLSTTGGGSKATRRRIKQLHVDISHWMLSVPKKTDLKAEEVFTYSIHNNCTIKRKILELNLIPYKCSVCGNEGKWNGKPLVLQLDHINGNHQDNHIENLRFLCPNCHSQTETFAGRNSSKEKSVAKKKFQ